MQKRDSGYLFLGCFFFFFLVVLLACEKKPATSSTSQNATSTTSSGTTGGTTGGTTTGGTTTGGSTTGGVSKSYNCVNGSCVEVSSGGQYPSLSACQSNCNSSNGGPPTGRFSVKIYYEPTGSCAATGVKQTLRFYTYCGNGKYSDNISAGIWVSGSDAGGKYIVCLFGNETACICAVDGSKTYSCYKRLYKLEWVVTPNKGSYPNSCILSGVSNIDFQDQIKNVEIKY